MNRIRNFEVSSLVGDKPVHVINEIPIEPYNPDIAKQWKDVFENKDYLRNTGK